MERKKAVTYQSCDFCDNADEAKGKCDICDKCFCEDHGQNYPWGDQLYQFCSEHYPIVDDIVKKTGIPVGFVLHKLRGEELSGFQQDLWNERGYESKWKATFADLVRSEAEEKSRKAYTKIARLESDARIAKGWQEVVKRGIGASQVAAGKEKKEQIEANLYKEEVHFQLNTSSSAFERAQVAGKEKKEQIELNLYKDERDNWRYNCDKLKVSGGFCPLGLAAELDEKYGVRMDKVLSRSPGIVPTAKLGLPAQEKPCYVISKIDNRLLVANKDGKIEEYVSLAHDDAMEAIHAIGAGRAIGAGINTLLKMLSDQEEKNSSTAVPK